VIRQLRKWLRCEEVVSTSETIRITPFSNQPLENNKSPELNNLGWLEGLLINPKNGSKI
jgi:hypothetical protein